MLMAWIDKWQQINRLLDIVPLQYSYRNLSNQRFLIKVLKPLALWWILAPNHLKCDEVQPRTTWNAISFSTKPNEHKLVTSPLKCNSCLQKVAKSVKMWLFKQRFVCRLKSWCTISNVIIFSKKLHDHLKCDTFEQEILKPAENKKNIFAEVSW